MEFIWKMTEENWKNMMHDTLINKNSIKKYDDLSDDYNFYGQMFVGDYCVEFLVEDFEEDGFLAFTNFYQLYIDNGYGITSDGIPYELINDCFKIPKTDNFIDFKYQCEKEFLKGIGNYIEIKNADKKCEWYQVKGE